MSFGPSRYEGTLRLRHGSQFVLLQPVPERRQLPPQGGRLHLPVQDGICRRRVPTGSVRKNQRRKRQDAATAGQNVQRKDWPLRPDQLHGTGQFLHAADLSTALPQFLSRIFLDFPGLEAALSTSPQAQVCAVCVESSQNIVYYKPSQADVKAIDWSHNYIGYYV